MDFLKMNSARVKSMMIRCITFCWNWITVCVSSYVRFFYQAKRLQRNIFITSIYIQYIWCPQLISIRISYTTSRLFVEFLWHFQWIKISYWLKNVALIFNEFDKCLRLKWIFQNEISFIDSFIRIFSFLSIYPLLFRNNILHVTFRSASCQVPWNWHLLYA